MERAGAKTTLENNNEGKGSAIMTCYKHKGLLSNILEAEPGKQRGVDRLLLDYNLQKIEQKEKVAKKIDG